MHDFSFGTLCDGAPGAPLDWSAGDVPVSRRFADPYFSLDGGLAETAHVFLAGNDLPARFARGDVHVAELGFGTGLNFLATLVAFRAVAPPGARLTYTGFEAFALSRADLTRALGAFPSLPAEVLLDATAPPRRRSGADFTLTVVDGDANDSLARWADCADAWFLDGFAPARNPEMWRPALLTEVARHTVPGGTFATYTAAGHVRRSLADAGFEVARVPGFGRKRHMTRGVLPLTEARDGGR